jgi:hypothetical protein
VVSPEALQLGSRLDEHHAPETNGRMWSAGAAVLRLMVRRGFTPRTNDNWGARCNGLMRSR